EGLAVARLRAVVVVAVVAGLEGVVARAQRPVRGGVGGGVGGDVDALVGVAAGAVDRAEEAVGDRVRPVQAERPALAPERRGVVRAHAQGGLVGDVVYRVVRAVLGGRLDRRRGLLILEGLAVARLRAVV